MPERMTRRRDTFPVLPQVQRLPPWDRIPAGGRVKTASPQPGAYGATAR
jgi:hypothetical protein